MLKKYKWQRLGVILTLGILAVFAFLVIAFLRQFDAPFSIPEINDRLGVAIPQDASNLIIIGHHGLTDGIGIEFDAPPASADHFVKQFCEGQLFKGYNPFDAIDVHEPVSNAYPIRLGIEYFSYSLQTPETIFGNRCLPLKMDQYVQVVLDIADPSLYHVKAEQFFSCTPCSYGGYIVTTPTESSRSGRTAR